MANPAIIQCSNTYIFTTPLPPGGVMEMIPSDFISKADIVPGYVGNTHSYFILFLSVSIQDEEDMIQDALQYVWGHLVNRGVAAGEMPEPVEGDPRAMLRG